MTARRKAAKQKHVPQRSCAVCRQVRPKRELMRLVHSLDAAVQIDSSGKAPGRGAYLCDNPACWEKAARTEVLGKALKTTLTEQDRALLAAHGAQLVPPLQSNHD